MTTSLTLLTPAKQLCASILSPLCAVGQWYNAAELASARSNSSLVQSITLMPSAFYTLSYGIYNGYTAADNYTTTNSFTTMVGNQVLDQILGSPSFDWMEKRFTFQAPNPAAQIPLNFTFRQVMRSPCNVWGTLIHPAVHGNVQLQLHSTSHPMDRRCTYTAAGE